MMARAFTPTGEVRIANRDVTINGEKRVLADRKQLREIVATYFGFDLPALETISVPSIPDWNTGARCLACARTASASPPPLSSA